MKVIDYDGGVSIEYIVVLVFEVVEFFVYDVVFVDGDYDFDLFVVVVG